jgi:hypothetical protein
MPPQHVNSPSSAEKRIWRGEASRSTEQITSKIHYFGFWKNFKQAYVLVQWKEHTGGGTEGRERRCCCCCWTDILTANRSEALVAVLPSSDRRGNKAFMFSRQLLITRWPSFGFLQCSDEISEFLEERTASMSKVTKPAYGGIEMKSPWKWRQ